MTVHAFRKWSLKVMPLGLVLGALPIGAQTLPPGRRAPTPAEFRLVTSDRNRIARQNGISLAVVNRIARILDASHPNVSPEKLVELAEKRASEAAVNRLLIVNLERALTQLKDPEFRDPALKAARLAQEAFDAGRFEEAEAQLEIVSSMRSSQSSANRNAWSQTMHARGGLAQLREDFDKAAQIYDEAATQRAAEANEAALDQWQFLMEWSVSEKARAFKFGDASAYEKAVTILSERALPLVPRKTMRLQWAKTQMEIGLAYFSWGSHLSGAVILQKAVNAYDLALEELKKESEPDLWAIAWKNIANPLTQLGFGLHDEVFLKRAVDASDQALTVFTLEKNPGQWAATTLNRSAPMARIGAMKRDPVLINRAIKDLEKAAKVADQAGSRYLVSAAQNNLCLAYPLLTEFENAAENFGKAVVACRQSLNGTDRANSEYGWAVTQGNLGTSLLMLGSVSNDMLMITDAAAALRAAQEVFTFERFPEQWLTSQVQLCRALLVLAQSSRSVADAQAADEAIKLLEENLTKFGAGPSAFADVKIIKSLRDVLFAELQIGPATAASETSDMREKATGFDRQKSPDHWAFQQFNVAMQLSHSALAKVDHEVALRSVEAFDLAEPYAVERLPTLWISIQCERAKIQTLFGIRFKSRRQMLHVRSTLLLARDRAAALHRPDLVQHAIQVLGLVDFAISRQKPNLKIPSEQ